MFKRLTFRDCAGAACFRWERPQSTDYIANKAISRLAEYEDIGMTPEEIKSALEDYKDLQKQYEALVCKMLR